MGCRLYNEKEEGLIKMKDLPNGRLAVVVDKSAPRVIGLIVARAYQYDDFTVLGKGHFPSDCELWVRELKEGEFIEVHYSE